MRRLLPYLLTLCIVTLFIANLLHGSVHIPADEVLSILFGGEGEKSAWRHIILESRLPQAITALLSGAALAVSGLMLQTAFNNPLAGPDILGINAGAGLGAAIVLLLFGGLIPVGNLFFGGSLALVGAAFIGALLVTLAIILFSTRLRNHTMLLIIGMMIGYIVSSVVSLLNFFSTAEGVQSYMMWGMGNFGGVSRHNLPLFAGFIFVGLFIFGKATQCIAAWRALCRKPRSKHTSHTSIATAIHRPISGCHHSLLRSHQLYRISRSTHGATTARHRQSPFTHAHHTAMRFRDSPVMQPHQLSTWR